MPAKTKTKAEVRVLIAKDVIKALDTKRFFARHGTYLSTSAYVRRIQEKLRRFFGSEPNVDEELVQPPPKRCAVCAIGGVFVATLDRYDKLNMSDVYASGGGIDHRETMESYLDRWWSQEQLDLMECAFEGRDPQGMLPYWAAEKGKAFFRAHGGLERDFFCDDTDERRKRHNQKKAPDIMRAIMKNIIKNKGTFRP